MKGGWRNGVLSQVGFSCGLCVCVGVCEIGRIKRVSW